ncbi:unnamed protein product [Lactuca virosa]|uniref:Uncharacterized protein n=1 Tax=Lactuca virosa TaxID=75947 RepID=A0AAU9PJZ0_9ASTR|nr:unnamed protein product [Lactuca virosa]
MAPVVGLVGLGLFQRGFSMLGNCVEIRLTMLLLLIGVSQQISHPLLHGLSFHTRYSGVHLLFQLAIRSRRYFVVTHSTSAYKAASRLAIATPPPAYVLCRGIRWHGISVLLDGLYGIGIGSIVSVENVGLLGLTRVGSRRVVQIYVGFMIFFSILGNLDEFVNCLGSDGTDS